MNTSKFAILYSLAFMLIFGSITAKAEGDIPKVNHPKICLVLSGGGARGAAHIGVLKVLEAYRVPIDCIVGTSMGAIVGAAYATGTTLSEMDDFTQMINTKILVKENPPRAEISIRRKQEDYDIFVGPEVGFKKGKISFGKGLVSGVQLESVLRKLSKAKGYRQFDQLPIRYRAVATDLLTGKPVVFSEGELANVMRASMSIPGVMVPADFGGKMLVDGMLTSNLPIEVAREMGADVIIAVNVGSPLLQQDQITDFLGVMDQMVNILTEQNVQNSMAFLRPQDILISPHLNKYKTSDFDELPKIAPLGESEAKKLANKLKALSLSEKEYAALRVKQTAALPPDLAPVDEIQFVHLKRVNPVYLKSLMKTKPHQELTQSVLDKDMSWIYGTGDFEHINYKIKNESGGKRVLEIEANEKSWGPDFFRFGLGLSSDFKGGSFFNVLASYRRTWLNSYGAEWRTDLQAGQNPKFFTELYQPLHSQQYFFVAPHAFIERHGVMLYQKRDRVGFYDILSAAAGVDIGSMFFRYGQLRLGLLKGVTEPLLESGATQYSPGDKSIDKGAFTAGLILDQIDSVHFPRYGWRMIGSLYHSDALLGAEDIYSKWVMDANAAYSFGEHTFNVGMRTGGKIGSHSLPRYDLFSWGGFLTQSGLKTGQLLGENLKFGRLMYYHRVMRGTLFEGAYAGLSLEMGKVGNPLIKENNSDWIKSGSIFFATDTPLGPVYFAYGREKHNNNSFYFYLGRAF